MATRKAITHIEPTESEKTRFASPRAPHVRYDDELAEYICEQIAMGRSLLSVCDEPNVPTAAAVIYWSAVNLCGFKQKYQDACNIRAQLFAEELIDIADDGRNDWIERNRKDGSTYVELNYEHISRSALRFKGRQWIISKLLSGVYGESTQLRLADADGKKLVAPPAILVMPVSPAKVEPAPAPEPEGI